MCRCEDARCQDVKTQTQKTERWKNGKKKWITKVEIIGGVDLDCTRELKKRKYPVACV